VPGFLVLPLKNPVGGGAGRVGGLTESGVHLNPRPPRRQTDAKALVRRQLDDVVFQVGKQLKDRLRLVQRSTRDHFTEIAEEHHRSLSDSVSAAQKAATTYTLEKEMRIRDIKAELKRVDALHRIAESVAAEPAGSKTAGAKAAAKPAGGPDARPQAAGPQAAGPQTAGPQASDTHAGSPQHGRHSAGVLSGNGHAPQAVAAG
jgi:hypothetical protein